jgi:hypothetical protein
MPDKRPSVKNEKQYEALKEKACRRSGLRVSRTRPTPRVTGARSRARAATHGKVGRRRRRRPPVAKEAGRRRANTRSAAADGCWTGSRQRKSGWRPRSKRRATLSVTRGYRGASRTRARSRTRERRPDERATGRVPGRAHTRSQRPRGPPSPDRHSPRATERLGVRRGRPRVAAFRRVVGQSWQSTSAGRRIGLHAGPGRHRAAGAHGPRGRREPRDRSSHIAVVCANGGSRT